jgi:hypothetical protein
MKLTSSFFLLLTGSVALLTCALAMVRADASPSSILLWGLVGWGAMLLRLRQARQAEIQTRTEQPAVLVPWKVNAAAR